MMVQPDWKTLCPNYPGRYPKRQWLIATPSRTNPNTKTDPAMRRGTNGLESSRLAAARATPQMIEKRASAIRMPGPPGGLRQDRIKQQPQQFKEIATYTHEIFVVIA